MAVRQSHDRWPQSLKPSADSQAHISSPQRRRYNENKIPSKTASPARTRVELLALVCATQSADRNLVRLPRRISSLSLKADTKMKTTDLKQTSVAKPRKWFQRRRHWHDPREARPERSQFRDQPPSREATASHRRSRLHLREFARNSRIFAAFAFGANRAPQFFFPRKSGSQNFAGIRYANATANERNLNP
jgi:hypothetical protein